MKKNIVKSSMVIFIINIISKLMGVIRTSIVGSFYGQTGITDSYNTANKIAMFATFVINTTIAMAVIPLITKVKEEHGKEARDRYFSRIINIVIIIDMILTLLLIIFAPVLVKIIASGFSGEQFDTTVQMVRIISPSIIFLGVVSCVGGYLQSNFSFAPFASIGIINNIIFYILLYFFGNKSSIALLAWITTIGAIAQAIYLLFFMKRSEYKYSFSLGLKDNYIKETFILLIPLMLNDLVNQVVWVFNTSVGSNLAEGRLTALTNSYNIFNSIQSLLIMSVVTVVFPILSEAINKKDFKSAEEYVKNGINIMILFLIPVSIGIIALAEPFTRVIFERGKFTPEDTIITKWALIYYSIGFFANGVKVYLYKVFTSFKDSMTTLKVQVVIVVFNILIALVLLKTMEYKALALSSSLAAIIGTLYLMLKLRYKIEDLELIVFIPNIIKVLISSLFMGVVTYFSYNYIIQALGIGLISTIISMAISTLIGIAAYAFGITIFKVEEFTTAIEKIKLKIKRVDKDK